MKPDPTTGTSGFSDADAARANLVDYAGVDAVFRTPRPIIKNPEHLLAAAVLLGAENTCLRLGQIRREGRREWSNREWAEAEEIIGWLTYESPLDFGTITAAICLDDDVVARVLIGYLDGKERIGGGPWRRNRVHLIETASGNLNRRIAVLDATRRKQKTKTQLQGGKRA